MTDTERMMPGNISMAKEIVSRAEDKLLRYMFEVGDFDVRHYSVSNRTCPGPDMDERVYRLDMEMKVTYIATPRQRKAAKRRLRLMYGKDFDRLVPVLHPLCRHMLG